MTLKNSAIVTNFRCLSIISSKPIDQSKHVRISVSRILISAYLKADMTKKCTKKPTRLSS